MPHWSSSSCFVVMFCSSRADMRTLPHRIDNEFFPWSHLYSLLVCTIINRDHRDTHCWWHRDDTKAFCVIVIIINSATEPQRGYHGWRYKSQRPILAYFPWWLHPSQVLCYCLLPSWSRCCFEPAWKNQLFLLPSKTFLYSCRSPNPSSFHNREGGLLMRLCSHGAP